MKITRIETRRVRVPVDRGVGLVADKRGFRFESDLLLLVIETDSDLCGVGEVTASPD